MRPLLLKEFRALFPMWISSVAVTVLHPLTSHDLMQVMVVLAYVFGSLALGAHAIGHEHSNRTLAILLVQPVPRRTLLLAKLAVLAPMLVTLAAAAWYGIISRLGDPPFSIARVLLPFVGGLFVAPWFTMLLKNQLSGVMGTGILGGWSMVVTGLVTLKLSDLPRSEAELLGLEIWTGMMYAFAAVSAVACWRTFMRLEAIEGAGRQIHMLRWFRTAERSRNHHPVRVLIGKELRLQQLTFAMAGFFVAGELIRAILQTSGLVRADAPIREVLIPLYLATIALVAGTLASAEERHAGMLESQQLLPMPAWRQWVIKSGVAVGLPLILGMPVLLLTYIDGSVVKVDRLLTSVGISALLMLVMTASGLYVSSLSSSGVRALAAAFPFLVGMYLVWEFIVTRTDVRDQAVFLVAFAFAALLLLFAGINHRRVDRSFTRMLWQIGCAAALIVGGIPFFTAIVDLTT